MRSLLLSITLLLCLSCSSHKKQSTIFIEKSKPVTSFKGTLELRFLKSRSINYTVSTLLEAASLPSLSAVTVDSTHRHVLPIRINPRSKSYRMKRRMKDTPLENKPELPQEEKLSLIHKELQKLYTVTLWEIDTTRDYRDSTKINLTGRTILSSSEPIWEGSAYTFISKLEELPITRDETEYLIGELAYINRDYRNRRERRYQEGDYVVSATVTSSDIFADIATLKKQLKAIPNSYYIKLIDETGLEFKR